MIEKLYAAIASEIKKVVPTVLKIYREDIPQNFKTPSMLVTTISTDAVRALAGSMKISHSFDLSYFPESKHEPLKEIEKVKQEIFRAFDVISAQDVSFYVKAKRFNTVDNVLHFYFEIDYKERIEADDPKMDALSGL